MKRLIGNLFVAVFFVIGTFSCSNENESTPKFIFKFKDNTKSIDLKGSNFFLLREGGQGDFTYRNYAITDGEYIQGEFGDELNEYTNATYLIFIQLAVRESFSAADYFQTTSWSTQSGDFYSYLYATSTDESSLFTDADDSPIKISGGFEDGQKMKLSFAGELNYSRLDQSTGNVINSDEEVVFYFEGRIDDTRQLD